MKRLLLLSICMLVSSVCFAQTHAEKKFIQMVVGNEHILYNENIDFYWINEIKQALTKTLFMTGNMHSVMKSIYCRIA